ncbi:MAG: hypothetical protein NTU80_06840 [Verrucomicrobia bacterium]|nr:hypothetical protein [Verrucomicrobiota bacterium]
MKPAPAARLLFLFALLLGALRADWRDDVGYTRLLQTYTTGVPTAVVSGVSQIEAPDGSANYAADSPGKAPTLKSGASGANGHASTVAVYFYSTASSVIPDTATIDAYNANAWLNSGFLKYGTTSAPLTEARRIQNHSWIAQFDRAQFTEATITSAVANFNQRLDYASDRDGFLAVVGTNNGASTTLPDLMVQGYHSLSVGLTSGNHAAGLTSHDIAGRMKPDLVAYESLTSFATPQVSSVAGLISEKLRNTAYTPSLATADYPRLTKAFLLAGATKDDLTSWSRVDTTKPYDATYGAGALNVLLSYRILSAGRQTASDSSTVADTGWTTSTVRSSTSASSRTYFFDISSGSTATRFSAALTWHRNLSFSTLTGGFSTSLPNLDLRLFPVTPGTFTLGTQLDASLSPVDNVEHLYQATLPPGRYALQVSSSSNSSTSYALAWRTSPTVTVEATAATARETNLSPATFTLTRTGPTTSPLLIPLTWGGTALPGTHYQTPPATALIPAGSSSTTVTITPVADDLAQGTRTVTLSLAQDYYLSVTTPATTTATLQDKPYDAWRFARFTAEQLAAPDTSGPTADPDADGLSNLLEYAFAREPLAPDSSPAPDSLSLLPASGSELYLALSFFQPSDRSDLNYLVEWTDDLTATWRSGPDYTSDVNAEARPTGEQITVRALTPLAAAPRQFLRLRVTRQ